MQTYSLYMCSHKQWDTELDFDISVYIFFMCTLAELLFYNSQCYVQLTFDYDLEFNKSYQQNILYEN